MQLHAKSFLAIQTRQCGRTPAPQRAGAARRPRTTPRSSGAAQEAPPAWLPAELADITEPAAQAMAARMRRTPLAVPSLPMPLDTAWVGPSEAQREVLAALGSSCPCVLLHGFDSSCLEFRRLMPLLEPHTPTYAVDLVGWGFTDHAAFERGPELPVSPAQKREHLYAFWTEHVRRPMALVGGSLGGAIAMDFALHHPEAVERLVLIDAQGFIDGIGPMASLPRPVAAAGVWVLQTRALRMAANRMAYHDQSLATEDAMRVGRLHTLMPGWAAANIAFMRSGGYALSQRVAEVQQPTLVLWGAQDAILEPQFARQFEATLPNAQLQWLDECGHCGHLEQPAEVAARLLRFIGAAAAPDAGAGAPQGADAALARVAELAELQ